MTSAVDTLLCTRCGEHKPQDEFFRENAKKRGFSSWCKRCVVAKRKAWRANNLEHAREVSRRYWQQNKDTHWRARNPERFAMVNRAAYHLKKAVAEGQLVRLTTCERCGADGPIDAAHHDYSQPLLVSWLCRTCHALWDKAQPKSVLRSAQ